MKDDIAMSEENQNTNTPENFPKSQEDLDRIIQERVAAKNRRIQELEAESAQHKKDLDAANSTLAQRDQEVQTLSTERDSSQRALLVERVAHSKGVPVRWLTGDTEEDLQASADDFLADVKNYGGQGKSSNDDGANSANQGAGNSGDGYVPSAGTGGETPQRPSYDELKQRAFERALERQKGVL